MVGATSILNSFESAAGVSVSHLSLVVRSIVCFMFFLWAGWNVIGQFKLVLTQELDIHDVPMTLLRILLLCSLMMALVFIG